MKKLFGYCFILLGSGLALPVQAEEDLQVNFNLWTSAGETRWRHDSGSPYFGVPTSELDYQGVNSNIAEVGLRKLLLSGHVIRFTLGTGYINDGTLVDDDYLSASGATKYGATQSGAHRYSRTHSDIDGNGLFYLKGELLPHQLKYTSALMDLQVRFGLHYWEEEYIATGLRQIECTVLTDPDISCSPAGTVAYTGVTVLTNKVQWTGAGVGLDYSFKIMQRLALQLAVTYYPIMSLVNEDTHHLRSDLSQNPSVRMTGNGKGYDLLAGFQLRFAPNVSAHLGYRVWERSVQDQTLTMYYSDGSAASARLMNFKTRREGLVGGVTVKF